MPEYLFLAPALPVLFSPYLNKNLVFSQVSSVLSLPHDTKLRVRVEKNKTVFSWWEHLLFSHHRNTWQAVWFPKLANSNYELASSSILLSWKSGNECETPPKLWLKWLEVIEDSIYIKQVQTFYEGTLLFPPSPGCPPSTPPSFSSSSWLQAWTSCQFQKPKMAFFWLSVGFLPFHLTVWTIVV